MSEFVVVKVGGSLYDLPDLGSRLRHWLGTDERVQPPATVLLVPGGGPAVDAIRALDRRHHLGEEAAHWLALRALSLNAHFLAALLPLATVVAEAGKSGLHVQILDVCAFFQADEARHGGQTIPHTWDATSDSVAAHVAVATQSRRLILLKSASLLDERVDWVEAARRGFVDAEFASMLRTGPSELEVSVVNLREWWP